LVDRLGRAAAVAAIDAGRGRQRVPGAVPPDGLRLVPELAVAGQVGEELLAVRLERVPDGVGQLDLDVDPDSAIDDRHATAGRVDRGENLEELGGGAHSVLPCFEPPGAARGVGGGVAADSGDGLS
jgi:hypothetical protein